MGYKSNLNLELLKCPTEEFCYILGYLWADGYLMKKTITMEILRKDADEINYLFDKTGVWIKKARQRKNRQPTFVFSLTETLFTDFLINHDFKEKSLKGPSKLKYWMGDNLFPFFIRGFLDGDGCVRVTKQSLVGKRGQQYLLFLASFSGALNQDWAWLVEELKKIKVEKFRWDRRIRNTGKGSEFTLNGRYAFAFIGDILTKTNFLGLKRKSDPFLTYKDYIKSSVNSCYFLGKSRNLCATSSL